MKQLLWKAEHSSNNLQKVLQRLMRRKEVCVVLHSSTGRAWCHLWWDFRQRLNTWSEQKRRQKTMLRINDTFLFSYPILCGCGIFIPIKSHRETHISESWHTLSHYLLLDIEWLNKCCTHPWGYIEAINSYLQMFQFKVMTPKSMTILSDFSNVFFCGSNDCCKTNKTS